MSKDYQARKFNVKDLETGKTFQWSIADMLVEINRDRSEGWLDYNETDWEEGWFEWVEGDYLKMLGEV